MARKGIDLIETFSNVVNELDEMIFGGEITENLTATKETNDVRREQPTTERVGNTFLTDKKKGKKESPATGGGSGLKPGTVADPKDDDATDDDGKPDGKKDSTGK